MRPLLILMMLLAMPMAVLAQVDGVYYSQKTKKVHEAPVSVSNMDTTHSFRKIISRKLKINDKIFVVNKTSRTIERMAIAVVDRDGKIFGLGTISDIKAGRTIEFKSYEDNGLRKLRGKTLVLKVKGEKPSDEKTARNSNAEAKAYDYDANLYENRHDLYIEVIDKNSKFMDF